MFIQIPTKHIKAVLSTKTVCDYESYNDGSYLSNHRTFYVCSIQFDSPRLNSAIPEKQLWKNSLMSEFFFFYYLPEQFYSLLG